MGDALLFGEEMVAFVLPALLTAFLAWPWARWLRARGIVDQPDPERRLHHHPTPRGGGVVMLIGMGAGLLYVAIAHANPLPYLGVAMLSLACVITGFWEDVRPRPVWIRLIAQFILAAGIVSVLGPIETVWINGAIWHGPWIWSALAWVALVWLMNIHNFMDGSDGLAASQGLWTMVCYALIFLGSDQPDWAWVSLIGAGTCFGFLFWNFPTARLFMGDSGSLWLGGLVGLLAYHAVATAAASVLVCLMISSVFVVDATATLLRRVFRGERWYTAHASHAFQRLISGGLSHRSVWLIYMLLNLLVVFPVCYWAYMASADEWWLTLGLLTTLVVAWWLVQSRYFKSKHKG